MPAQIDGRDFSVPAEVRIDCDHGGSDRILNGKHAVFGDFDKLSDKCKVDCSGRSHGRSPVVRGMNAVSTNGIITGRQMTLPARMWGCISAVILRWLNN